MGIAKAKKSAATKAAATKAAAEAASAATTDAAPHSPVGWHLLFDLYEVEPERLRDQKLLGRMLTDAAKEAGMTALSAPVLHVFPGGGVTGFLPLAESHLAFHTYPEWGYCAADLFTCGNPEGPALAAAIIQDALEPGRVQSRQITRGDKIAAGDDAR